jgi:hypothetical protein
MSEPSKGISDQDWRNYPTVERMLKEDPSPVFSKMEKTCRRLEEFGRNGSPAEQTRAKAAITAYGRTMDLMRLLAETRDKLMAEQAR